MRVDYVTRILCIHTKGHKNRRFVDNIRGVRPHDVDPKNASAGLIGQNLTPAVALA